MYIICPRLFGIIYLVDRIINAELYIGIILNVHVNLSVSQLINDITRGGITMKKLLCTFIFMISLLSLTSCRDQVLEKAQETVKQYNKQLAQYNEKISEYNQAVDQITKGNKDIEDEINKAQTVIDKGETPFDEKTLTTLKDSMGEADKTKVSVPEKLPEYGELKVDEEVKTDDIKAMIEKAEEDMEAMEKCEVPTVPCLLYLKFRMFPR